jgi:SAM-dependent methyltransferase
VLVLLSEKARSKRELVQQIKERSAGNRSFRPTGVLWPASREVDAVLTRLAGDALVKPPKRGHRWRITEAGKQTLARCEKPEQDGDGKERAAEKLIELLESAPADAYVLDVGTGKGFLALKLAERGFHVVGIDSGSFDYSKDSIEQARDEARRQGGDVEFRQVDIRRCVEPDGRFDYVVSSQAVHCMDDQRECLQAIRRLLKPGGKFLCIDFLVGVYGFVKHGFHCFLALSREEWVDVLVECGFANIRMHELGDYLLIECERG